MVVCGLKIHIILRKDEYYFKTCLGIGIISELEVISETPPIHILKTR